SCCTTHSRTSSEMLRSFCDARLIALSILVLIHFGSGFSPQETIRFSSTWYISVTGIPPLIRQLAVWKRSSSRLPDSNILLLFVTDVALCCKLFCCSLIL